MDTGNQGVGSGEGEWGCQQVSMLLGVLCDSPRALGSGDISIDSWGVIEKLIGHCMVRVTCWSQGGEEEIHARLCPGTLLVWKFLSGDRHDFKQPGRYQGMVSAPGTAPVVPQLVLWGLRFCSLPGAE